MVAAAVVTVAVSISSSSSSSSNMSSNSSSNTRSSCKLLPIREKKHCCWYCNTKPQAITRSQILTQNLLREISTTTTHTKQPKRLQQLCTVTNTSTKVIIGIAIQKSSHHTFANTHAKFLRREISTAKPHTKHSTEMAV